MDTVTALDPSAVVVPVIAGPGATIELTGKWSLASRDFVIDACQSGRSGAGTPTAGGAFDYAAGGWQVQSRDWQSHTCRLVATGERAQACEMAGVSAPCLPSRLVSVASSPQVMMPAEEMVAELKGGMSLRVLEGVAAPTPMVANVLVQPQSFWSRYGVWIGPLGAVLIALALIVVRSTRRRALAPEAIVKRVAKQVRARLEKAEPVYKRLIPQVDALAGQAGTLATLRDRLRARVVTADKPALEQRREALRVRADAGGTEAAEARVHVEKQLEHVTRWENESKRASDRIDRALEFLRALDTRLVDEMDRTDKSATGVRVDEDAKLLRELEQDVHASLEGAREADDVSHSLRAAG